MVTPLKKLQRDFTVLGQMIETVLGKTCFFSGPIPMRQQSSEVFSRLYSIDQWLNRVLRTAFGYGYLSNFDLFWKKHHLFRKDGLHPNYKGLTALANNFYRIVQSN